MHPHVTLRDASLRDASRNKLPNRPDLITMCGIPCIWMLVHIDTDVDPSGILWPKGSIAIPIVIHWKMILLSSPVLSAEFQVLTTTARCDSRRHVLPIPELRSGS